MKNRWLTVTTGAAVIGMLTAALILTGVDLSSAQAGKPERAWRLTATYRAGTIELDRIDTLNMIIPLTIKEMIIREGELTTGFFWEMYDDSARLVLRSRMHDPTRTLMEYEDPDNPGQIRSQEVVHDTITFTVIVPAPESARTIRIGRVPIGRDTTGEKTPQKEYLGEFSLPGLKR
ncbi:MAG: hypothetical protein JSU74_05045 [Candidatus Zixiibacteriota bacterium]|nr:MAG: hypothetical protein JSU74_05045 [candidate division Zixibacteria bacterium]